MQQKTERFEMRFDPITLNRVENWRANQPDAPSRAEAIRRLIEVGLSVDENKFRPSGGEKLIIAMLCDLYGRLPVDETTHGVYDFDPSFIDKAAVGEDHWALEWEYPHMFKGVVQNEEIASEVAGVLDMWEWIELSYDRLSPEDKTFLKETRDITNERVQFQGFDGNEEPDHYRIASIMIGDMGLFRHFKGRYLNSHLPWLDSYRRMLSSFESMKDALRNKYRLSKEDIVRLINPERPN